MTSLVERLEPQIQALLFKVMQLLPTERATDLGVLVTKQNVIRNRPEILEGARRNLMIDFPSDSGDEIEVKIGQFLENIGRFMAEFAVMDRLIPEGRLNYIGLDAFRRAVDQGPIIALGLHTGNWETFGPAFADAKIPLASFYDPPVNVFERTIAESTRKRFGVKLLTPDSSGTREAIRLLRQNRVVMIFPDEARGGRVMGPLFGRAPHLKGNLAIATRLARHSGARFAICHSERRGKGHFNLFFGEPFDLPERASRPDHRADVAFLNNHVEPLVRRNLPRWYFLDDSRAPITDASIDGGEI
jgi:Kdo2-lipid IVA lauroyltransferase/acyltransferase